MKSRIVLLSIFLITGCSVLHPVPPKICEVIPRIDPPIPSPVVLVAPEFYVVSDKNKESFEVRIQKDSGGVYYAITPTGYTILAQNMQELRRYIKELQQVIIYYKNYDSKKLPGNKH